MARRLPRRPRPARRRPARPCHHSRRARPRRHRGDAFGRRRPCWGWLPQCRQHPRRRGVRRHCRHTRDGQQRRNGRHLSGSLREHQRHRQLRGGGFVRSQRRGREPARRPCSPTGGAVTGLRHPQRAERVHPGCRHAGGHRGRHCGWQPERRRPRADDRHLARHNVRDRVWVLRGQRHGGPSGRRQLDYRRRPAHPRQRCHRVRGRRTAHPRRDLGPRRGRRSPQRRQRPHDAGADHPGGRLLRHQQLRPNRQPIRRGRGRHPRHGAALRGQYRRRHNRRQPRPQRQSDKPHWPRPHRRRADLLRSRPEQWRGARSRGVDHRRQRPEFQHRWHRRYAEQSHGYGGWRLEQRSYRLRLSGGDRDPRWRQRLRPISSPTASSTTWTSRGIIRRPRTYSSWATSTSTACSTWVSTTSS